MKIHLTEIFAGNSDVAQIDHQFSAEYFELTGHKYLAKSPISVKAELRKLEDKSFLLEGQVGLTIEIPCSRCTEAVDYPIQASFSKDLKLLSEIDIKSLQEQGEELEEQEYLSGYVMDLEKLVYDELYMNFPMKVLCDEACQGICMQCGVNLNEQTCDCHNDNVDLRLAGLKDLFKEF